VFFAAKLQRGNASPCLISLNRDRIFAFVGMRNAANREIRRTMCGKRRNACTGPMKDHTGLDGCAIDVRVKQHSRVYDWAV
jgi:hypothetical protein